jgi:type II secretory pathway pseudopilin PulG
LRLAPGGTIGSPRPEQRGYGLIELLVTMAVMIVVLSLTVETIVQFQRSYRAQTQLVDVQYNARAAADTLLRLLRNAHIVEADPDGNGVFDSITIQGDFNPTDGSYDGSYETMTFTTAGGMLLKEEPTDGGPIPFADRIASVTFAYADTDGVPLADPVADAGRIALVNFVIVTTATPNARPMTLGSAVAVRSRP